MNDLELNQLEDQTLQFDAETAKAKLEMEANQYDNQDHSFHGQLQEKINEIQLSISK